MGWIHAMFKVSGKIYGIQIMIRGPLETTLETACIKCEVVINIYKLLNFINYYEVCYAV